MRICNKCKQDKQDADFYTVPNSDRLRTICKQCICQQASEYDNSHKDKVKQTKAAYRANNRGKFRARYKGYYERNKDKINLQHKAYRATPEAKLKHKEANKLRQRKYRANPMKKVINSCRRRIHHALTNQLTSKTTRTLELTGCTVAQLVAHLENQFTNGMTWDNYGLKGWHIDHIKPVSSFNLMDANEQKLCFHFTNLQPLWWFDNLKKSSSYKIANPKTSME